MLVAEGFSDKGVGRRLGMSERTVETHLQRLYQRHGVHTRAALVALWLRAETSSARPGESERTAGHG